MSAVMLEYENIRAGLASLSEDKIIFDLAGIEERYDWLIRELPDVSVRFAVKACPVDGVLECLAKKGSGFDVASPNEIAQVSATGVPVSMVHFGNTVKSDWNIRQAYRSGVRDFATDSLEDVEAIAAHAPGSRIFCRLANSGDGALWKLGGKFGCSPGDAIRVCEMARALGLHPAGLSVHVGSQQMEAESWQRAVESLAYVIWAVGQRGIFLDYINLGGGLPALGYLDKKGQPLVPAMSQIFETIRGGIEYLKEMSRSPLDFIVEPGRYLIADNGAIRAHVFRLSSRQQLNGRRQNWLYLSCGKFNGLYEMDQVQYRLVFPSHEDAECVTAIISGPTCDSEDAYGLDQSLVRVPRAIASGDPVWILSSGAYAISYTTLGFNGFSPLPCSLIRGGNTVTISRAS